MAWAETYLLTKWHIDPSSRLATINMGLKVGDCVSIKGELGPHLTQCRLGQALPPYQHNNNNRFTALCPGLRGEPEETLTHLPS